MLTIEALNMMLCRPSPLSILVFSGRHNIITNASIVNKLVIVLSRVTGIKVLSTCASPLMGNRTLYLVKAENFRPYYANTRIILRIK